MSTLLTLRGKLRTEIKIDPSGRIWTDSTLNAAINQAVNQLQQDGDYMWHFNDGVNTEPTVIGQSAYTLPSNFVRLELGSLLYDGGQLHPKTYNELWVDGLTTATNGTPSYYALRGTSLYLAQPPDAIKTLTYLYRTKLTAMSADANDSGVPDAFDIALVKWAAYLCWSTIEGRSDKAVAAAQDYQEAMKGLNAQYLGRRQDENYQFQYETI
jgi:hypothetical protein